MQALHPPVVYTIRRLLFHSVCTGGIVILHQMNLRSVAVTRAQGSSYPTCILLLFLILFYFSGRLKVK